MIRKSGCGPWICRCPSDQAGHVYRDHDDASFLTQILGAYDVLTIDPILVFPYEAIEGSVGIHTAGFYLYHTDPSAVSNKEIHFLGAI